MRSVYSRGHGKMHKHTLYMLEHLHVFFNSLRHGVEKLPNHARYMNRLRGIERFMSDLLLRRLIVATCLPGGEHHPDANLFRHYSTVHIGWGWEMMEKAFDMLPPLLPAIRRQFDLEKLLSKTADGKVDAQTIRDAKLFLDMPFSTGFSE
eukprot:6220005-Pyramimonas_sp.AAC.1